jgi:hypothetical protein
MHGRAFDSVDLLATSLVQWRVELRGFRVADPGVIVRQLTLTFYWKRYIFP